MHNEFEYFVERLLDKCTSSSRCLFFFPFVCVVENTRNNISLENIFHSLFVQLYNFFNGAKL